jgi:hypothetical protein
MERIVKKSKDFNEADDWDVLQQITMTPDQRMKIAKELRDRYYCADSKKVRKCIKIR